MIKATSQITDKKIEFEINDVETTEQPFGKR